MTGKLHKTLKGQTFDTPPIWLMRQAGRYLPEYLETRKTAGSFLDLCYSPDFATEVTLQPIRRFDFDAAILFSDILTIPHALGQDLQFAPDHGPLLGECPPIEKLATQGTELFHVNLSPVYEAVSSIRSALDKENFTSTDLIGFSGAPWTLACYMIDRRGSKEFTNTRVMALSDEPAFSKLINLLADQIAEYLAKQIDHGANVVQIFDSWAGVLPADQFRKWVIAPTKKIVTKLKQSHPDTPVIGFPKGAAFLYPEYVRETGIDAVGLDTQMPLEFAAKELLPLCPVQGNLDPMTLRAGGVELDRQIKNIKSAFAGKPYIFNLGHGIDKDTPPEHVAHLVKKVRETA